MDNEPTLLDYWNVVKKGRWLILSLFFSTVLATLIISLMLPKIYQARTTILPLSQEQGGLSAALSASPLAGLGGLPGIQSPTDKLLVVLQSRTVAEEVIKKLDLLRLFNEDQWDTAHADWKDPEKKPMMEDVIKKLQSSVINVSSDRRGVVTLTAEWRNPVLAARIANAYVDALSGFLNEHSINTNFQVIDPAVPPERKFKPSIRQNLILAGVVSLFVGLALVFFREYWESVKRGEKREIG
jgi:protein tyrosine kinase modulator